MGVVKRQGIKQSIAAYAGMFIGAINLLIIYPAVFTEDQIGIINFVKDFAILVCPFLFWGGAEMIVRFFPRFKNKSSGHNGYLFWLHIIFLFGISSLVILYCFAGKEIVAYYGKKSPYFTEYLPFFLPMSVLLTYASILSSHASNFQRIVIPTIISDLIPKIGLGIIAVLFWVQWINFDNVFWGQLVMYGLLLAGQFFYLHSIGELNLKPNLKFIEKPLLKETVSFGIYGLVGSLGSRLGERINTIMLGTVSSLGNTGIYSVAFFISDSIDAPRRAISRISSPLLAEKWQSGKMAEIEDLYKKSALNQLIIGAVMLLTVWVSVEEIFRIMPNGENFISGKYVVLILGLARVIDMATGLNSEIISYSENYKVNLYLILILAFTNVVANIILIPIYHINGAALATFISLTIYNLLKFGFINWKWGLHPFSVKMVFVIVLGLVIYFLSTIIPQSGYPFLDLTIKSTTSLALFVGLLYYFHLSSDFNHILDGAVGFFQKIRNKK